MKVPLIITNIINGPTAVIISLSIDITNNQIYALCHGSRPVRQIRQISYICLLEKKFGKCLALKIATKRLKHEACQLLTTTQLCHRLDVLGQKRDEFLLAENREGGARRGKGNEEMMVIYFLQFF